MSIEESLSVFQLCPKLFATITGSVHNEAADKENVRFRTVYSCQAISAFKDSDTLFPPGHLKCVIYSTHRKTKNPPPHPHCFLSGGRIMQAFVFVSKCTLGLRMLLSEVCVRAVIVSREEGRIC